MHHPKKGLDVTLSSSALPYAWGVSPHTSQDMTVPDWSDRGLFYGDGFFTTLLVAYPNVLNWPAHQARLQNSAERLGMGSIDWATLYRGLRQGYEHGPAPRPVEVLKILVTRGSGGRGYAPPSTQTPGHYYFYRMPYPYPQEDAPVMTDAMALSSRIAALPQFECHLQRSEVRLGRQPLLAGLKHLNRLENVLAQQALQGTTEPGASHQINDAVMCDTQGHVIGTTQANLVALEGHTLITPILDQAGVAGTCLSGIQQAVSEILGAPWQWRAQRMTWSDLLQADAVFATNAIRGVMPVTVLDQASRSTPSLWSRGLPIHQAWLQWQVTHALSMDALHE